MKNILSPEEFLNESYQRQLADEEMNQSLFRFFEKVFYEIKDKRGDFPRPHQLEHLTPEAKEYLLDVLDVVKEFDRRYKNTGRIQHPDNNRILTTDDELISYLSAMFFGGFGRPSTALGSSQKPVEGLRLPVPPSQDVVESIIKFAQSR